MHIIGIAAKASEQQEQGKKKDQPAKLVSGLASTEIDFELVFDDDFAAVVNFSSNSIDSRIFFGVELNLLGENQALVLFDIIRAVEVAEERAFFIDSEFQEVFIGVLKSSYSSSGGGIIIARIVFFQFFAYWNYYSIQVHQLVICVKIYSSSGESFLFNSFFGDDFSQ